MHKQHHHHHQQQQQQPVTYRVVRALMTMPMTMSLIIYEATSWQNLLI